jgi:cell wall-associated NlpC family hydrolase
MPSLPVFSEGKRAIMKANCRASVSDAWAIGVSQKRPTNLMASKTILQWFLLVAILIGTARAAHPAEESLGRKIKKFLTATPTPTPARKHRKRPAIKSTPTPSPTASPKRKKTSPTPSPSPTPETKAKTKRRKASATPTPTPSPTETPEATATPSATVKPTPQKKGAPNVTLSPEEIVDFDVDPPKVRQIIEAGLELTKQNLGYTYGSANPANGGMDCSGFVYYVLQQNGFSDVPRDSSQQYIWVRKAGNFNAVLSHHEDTFELDALKPGDLLFWSGTYNIDRDPPITHVMIYLGREKRTKKRVMVGASDGRTYDGKQRFGISVFDFKLPPPPNSTEAKLSPVFVGYGRIPGLSEE